MKYLILCLALAGCVDKADLDECKQKCKDLGAQLWSFKIVGGSPGCSCGGLTGVDDEVETK